MKNDLISIKDLSQEQINDLFALADKLKKHKEKFYDILQGKSICLIFHKPSLRTRISFEVGISQLGGSAIYSAEFGLGQRETIKDVAKTLSRYIDGIVVRTFEHGNIIDLALHASVPVINGLSDLLHPCQALSDFYTIREKLGKLKGVNLAYLGDGNNVSHSLLYGAARLGVNMHIATPRGYEPQENIVEEAKQLAHESAADISISNDPARSIKEADVVYTDVWASMGQEGERQQRKDIFASFQVNEKIMDLAKENALVMHCLPAHRGEEISDEVIDSNNSIVFDQAENRLHVQKAILIKLLGDKK